MSEDCQKCGTAMYELDEERLCPGCSDVDEIDLLTTCGTFNTKDCVSSDELCKLLNLKGETRDN
jgi:hypothetical protein